MVLDEVLNIIARSPFRDIRVFSRESKQGQGRGRIYWANNSAWDLVRRLRKKTPI